MISRRRFIEQTSLMAVSAVLANCAFAGIGGANEDALTPDPKLLERAKALLNKAPFIDTHNAISNALHHLEIVTGKKYRQALFASQLD